MKTIFLHGLGQTAQDWEEVIRQTALSEVDCPELFPCRKGRLRISAYETDWKSDMRISQSLFVYAVFLLGLFLPLIMRSGITNRWPLLY